MVDDISAAAGGTVQFRFRLTSDSSVTYAGYYIDKVAVTGAGGCTPQRWFGGGSLRQHNTAAGNGQRYGGVTF
jgi:hypothetical protein